MVVEHSLANKDSETVRRKWLWLFLIIYGVLFLVTIIFLALYAASYSKRSDLQTDVESLQVQNEELQRNNTDMQNEITKLNQNSAALEQELVWLKNNISILNNSITTKTKALNETRASLSERQQFLMYCLIGGGASVLANLGLIPYSIYQRTSLNSLNEKIEYYKPRYYQGAISTIESVLQRAQNKNVSLKQLYSASGKYVRADFNRSVHNCDNTVTIMQTDKDEVLAFVLHTPWNLAADRLEDSKAYTISFRNFMTAKIINGKPAVKSRTDFLEIGEGEIVINSEGKGTAIANRSFTPERSNVDFTNFYAQDGKLTLKSLSVYHWTIV